MQKLSMEALARKSVPEFKQADKIPVVALLDNIRSMNNVGSVFRTADAFLLESIILCGYTPRPPHRDINKTALGATESVVWHYEPDAVAAVLKLKENGYKVYSVEQVLGSVALDKFDFGSIEKLVMIYGNEVEGVSQSLIDICDGCIEIPQHGTKHSLNISIAAGITFWEAAKAYINKDIRS